MKQGICFIAIAGFLMFLGGCGDDNPTENSSSRSLLIEGKMFYWNYGSDKLLMFGEHGASRKEGFSYGNINADGSFKITVPPPPHSLLRPIKNLYDAEDGLDSVFISDTNTRFYEGCPIVYDGADYLGTIYWHASTLKDGFESHTEHYFYFTRPVTIKGRAYDKSKYDYIAFDFIAETGWNKIYLRYKSNSDPLYKNDFPENSFGYYEFEGLIYPHKNIFL